MPTDYQFGFESYLYVGVGLLTEDTDDGSGTVGANKASLAWADYATVRDSGNEGSPNQIDITTRLEARKGQQPQAIVSTANTLTFQIRYTPNSKGDLLYRRLLLAQTNSAEIALMELDGDYVTNTDSLNDKRPMGLVGNFTVSLSKSRPVQDLFVVDVTGTATTHFHWVEHDATLTKFKIFDTEALS